MLEGDGVSLTAIATPGHTMNHLAYAFTEENALFSGDHVMAWSTSIVAPPDGDMGAYMQSLESAEGARRGHILARDMAGRSTNRNASCAGC